MIIGAPEFARRAGISERRVQQLIASGRIKASKVSSRWMIEESELLKRRPVGRPLNPRMSYALLAALSGNSIPEQLDPAERSRLRKRIKELKNSDEAAMQIHSLLVDRAQVHRFNAHRNDLIRMHDEELVLPSGVSDPKMGISDGGYFEGYIEEKNLRQVVKKHLLVPSEKGNVILRVSKVGALNEIKDGLSVADLADHNESRAERKLIEILQSL